MRPLKLMVFGYARHGKDTVGELFQKKFGLRPVSSSWFAAEKIMVPYFASKGISYPSLEACYADRMHHRKEWFDEIAAYNEPFLTRLAHAIFAEYDIYVGVRNNREFNGVKCAGLFDFSIWVDRSNHLPEEQESSNKMKPWMADFILDNNGTLEELSARVDLLYATMLAKKRGQISE